MDVSASSKISVAREIFKTHFTLDATHTTYDTKRDETSTYSGNCTEGEVIYPFAYSGTKALVNPRVNQNRDIAMTNVLRTQGDHNTVRGKIVKWTESFVKDHGLENVSSIGTAGGGSSSSHFDQTYLNHLANSKIIVTCNPYRWEGDFR